MTTRTRRKVTTRTRRRAAEPEAKPARKSRMFHRGDEGRKRVDSEIAKANAAKERRQQDKNMPWRFRCPVGETRPIIVLDDKPDFFAYEHSMQDPQTGKWGFFKPCIKDWDNCPLCEKVGESYYALYLTALDLTPYETKRGMNIEFSRKLLVVKPSQHKKFMRRYEKEGTLRGAYFEMTRDKQMESSIGGDIEFIEMVDEDELSEYVRTWKDQEGKRQEEDCSVAFDYEELFTEPTRAELAALVGADPTPGSRESNEKELDDDPDDEWEDEEEDEDPPFDPDEKEEEEAEEEDEPEEEEEEEEEPPRARRRRRR